MTSIRKLRISSNSTNLLMLTVLFMVAEMQRYLKSKCKQYPRYIALSIWQEDDIFREYHILKGKLFILVAKFVAIYVIIKRIRSQSSEKLFKSSYSTYTTLLNFIKRI